MLSPWNLSDDRMFNLWKLCATDPEEGERRFLSVGQFPLTLGFSVS